MRACRFKVPVFIVARRRGVNIFMAAAGDATGMRRKTSILVRPGPNSSRAP